MSENLTYYEPTEEQLEKFHRVNEAPEWIHDAACVNYNDCASCPIAIHQWLISTEIHHCTYGMTEEKFRTIMFDADCSY